MKIKEAVCIGVGSVALAALGGAVIRFNQGRRRADQVCAAARYPKLEDLGTVKRLTILPLIDWYTARDPSTSSGQAPSTGGSTGPSVSLRASSPHSSGRVLAVEPGISYLVRADDSTILFDVGLNARTEHPSPLLRNMEALGVDLADIDALVISHLHEDHVGGVRQMMQHTFALSGEPVDLKGVCAYVPVPISNPTARVRVVHEPRVIAPGVASMGPIPRQMFFFGWTLEQSLAVNVEGKGIVLIIGCGHPTLPRIVERAEMLFDEPIYGVIGGLHYPVTASRATKFGIPLQSVFCTGKLPWRPISQRDVMGNIAFLQRRDPQLVSLSPHDSCDWSIEAFRSAFGEAYRELRVGEVISV